MITKKNKWDFFIAHSGADKKPAKDLYALLEPHSSPFVDSQCLLLGDDWDKEIANAQRKSAITIVLISSNTDEAYYQREEIAAAISLARKDSNLHRVIPVFLDEKCIENNAIPYGLRLKHGITLTDQVQLRDVAEELVNLLSRLSITSKEQQRTPTSWPIDIVNTYKPQKEDAYIYEDSKKSLNLDKLVNLDLIHNVIETRQVVEYNLLLSNKLEEKDELLNKLDSSLVKMRLAKKTSNIDDFIECDKSFHIILAGSSHNLLLNKLLGNLGNVFDCQQKLMLMIPGVMDSAIGFHERIFNGLRDGDHAVMTDNLGKHLGKLETNWKNLLSTNKIKHDQVNLLDFTTVYDLRESIEIAAVEKNFSKLRDKQTLDNFIIRFSNSYKLGDYFGFIDAYVGFHNYLCLKDAFYKARMTDLNPIILMQARIIFVSSFIVSETLNNHINLLLCIESDNLAQAKDILLGQIQLERKSWIKMVDGT